MSEIQTFNTMLGATIDHIDGGRPFDETMRFVASDGRAFTFFHDQDCCEVVRIVDVIGDINDLLHTPIVQAESVSSEGAPPVADPDSYTWTFYRFATVKGSVTVRWLGESNGYYSERVDFKEERSDAP